MNNINKILTSREKEVLNLVVRGMSNTDIAKKLLISSHTAKAHVCSILTKLQVEDRVQAAVKAVLCGLVVINLEEFFYSEKRPHK